MAIAVDGSIFTPNPLTMIARTLIVTCTLVAMLSSSQKVAVSTINKSVVTQTVSQSADPFCDRIPVWQALWVPSGEQPGTAKVWGNRGTYIDFPVRSTDIGPCDTAPDWVSATAYPMGSYVKYNGKLFRAKYWTQGDTPRGFGIWPDGPWEDLGYC